MPSQPALPPLLTPYLSPASQSPQSLTLITSVLAATSNWLILRYLVSVLSAADRARGDADNQISEPARKIVLVSFLRNWEFWRAEAKRLGLDLQRSTDSGRLRFVDGLTGLYSSPASAQQDSSVPGRGTNLGGSAGVSSRTTTIVPGQRGPTGRAPLAPPVPLPTTNTNASSRSTPSTKHLHISGQGSGALDGLQKDILAVIASVKSTDGDDTLLILDQPDLLLAATPGVNAVDMADWIAGLQQHVHSTIVTASADSPLVHNAYVAGEEGHATPLETQHSAFVVELAHQARLVMQLRTLDTGAAKDVSGVLRISTGGGFDEDADAAVETKEVLYFVQRDGGVRVFGRGEA